MFKKSSLRSSLLAVLCAAALPLSVIAQSAPTQKSAVLFENVRIFTGEKTLSQPSNVLVVGNVIQAISRQPLAIPPGVEATKIEGKGRTLMPGLIDNHVHLTLNSTGEHELLSPNMTPEALTEAASKDAKAMLQRGITAVRDVGGPVFALKALIDQGKAEGPRIYPSGAMISQTSGHGDFRLPNERSRRFGGTVSRGELLGAAFIADGRDEVLTATRENLRMGASQIKVMAGGGAASAYDPLDVSQYTLDEMKAAVDAASDWGTYVMVHAYTPKAVRRAIEAGVKSIEHGQLLDEATVKFVAQKGVWLSMQTLSEAAPTQAEHVRVKKHEVILGTSNVFHWAKKYKVKLAWGTDFLFGLEHDQNANMLKLQEWFSPEEVLRIITKNNAELLALSGPRNPYPGKLGVVEERALADLLLVDGDPVADINLIANPEKSLLIVMKDGKIYKNALK